MNTNEEDVMAVMPPALPERQYNQECRGYIGKFGEGGNAYIKFMQTAFKSQQLEATTLIENIKGSEKWEVKDLFQRDVDEVRVAKSIIPYLQNDAAVKFFNPLTLLLLPMQDDGLEAQPIIEYVEGMQVSEDGVQYVEQG
ncbi:MAG TPA: hypothetical protein EYO59_01330 [Chromatiaceae bacterium]|nr:hypothetical protein [Chromatiaceae bacterium]